MTTPLTIRGPIEAACVAPWILGFEPTESLVVLGFGGGSPTTRLDMPPTVHDLPEAVETITRAYNRSPGTILLLCFSDDTDMTHHLVTALSAMLEEVCDVRGAMQVQRGMVTVIGTGQRLSITQEDRDRIAAPMIAAGRPAPSASRTELEAALSDADTAATAAVADHAAAIAAAGLLGSSESERAWVFARLRRFLVDAMPLDEVDTARLLVDLSNDVECRDAVAASITTQTACKVVDLLADVARRTPAEHRPRLGSLLAFARWLNGEGAQAWIALDWSGAADSLASIVSAVLQSGVNPAEWDARRDTEQPVLA